MKQLCAAILALVLAACGGGGDTSSNAGNDSTFGTTSSSQEDSTSGASESNGTGTTSSSNSESASGSESSADGTYRGQLTATLSGEGVVPVTDSTELVIEISGSRVTASAEGRSYKGDLSGDSFSVEIPIDEESRGIVCQGAPVLEGKVEDGTASGTVSGKGECFSETANVPVSVNGEFSTRK